MGAKLTQCFIMNIFLSIAIISLSHCSFFILSYLFIFFLDSVQEILFKLLEICLVHRLVSPIEPALVSSLVKIKYFISKYILDFLCLCYSRRFLLYLLL